MVNELIKDTPELEEIANLMSNEIRNPHEDIVSRYIRVVNDFTGFVNGKKIGGTSATENFNLEMMQRGIYAETTVDNLLPHNFAEVVVARDLQPNRFNFYPKGIELPREEGKFVQPIPTSIDMYDNELREFTKEHENTRLTRTLTVEQRVVVNSRGGVAIQTIPFFGISYSHGYNPIPTTRDLSVVCTSEDDIKGLTKLIKHLADPTIDKRIKSTDTFSEAFHELHNISGLKYGSLEDAGIPLSGLYDVVVLNGVPVHEVFGHHFEEPIRFLDFGETGAFRYGQNILNKDIVMMDNPGQEVDGYKVQGFTFVDAYGRTRAPRVHIKDGQVVSFLGSEYADPEKFKQYINLEKSEFVGNASQGVDGFLPQPRMSCTVIDGPTENIDLEGKILLVPNAGHTQPHDKTYVVNSYESYVIKNGEPKRVTPLNVTGGINQALANIVLLDDVNYHIGVCGAPEPIYYPQSRGQSQVPVSQFTKSQMWQGQQLYPMPISDVHLKVLTK